uniref:FHOD3 protein n=1 Tax=Soboliphyme baturini TaxID=241478 RepID=A0A183IWC0_9BILA
LFYFYDFICFQDDKDLVHEFVQNDGLSCLIKVGTESDQNYQNYILRALGQVMLYVDGMNGVIAHNATIQWLYSLLGSPFRLVVKTALKLLLVFVEYAESNSLLLLAAVSIVDRDRRATNWSNVMGIINDRDTVDPELLVFAMTLINQTLNGIPDQDTYYDVVDALEEQGMEEAISRMTNLGSRELREQCSIYESVLRNEDEDDSSIQNIAVARGTAMEPSLNKSTNRSRTGSDERRSVRKWSTDKTAVDDRVKFSPVQNGGEQPVPESRPKRKVQTGRIKELIKATETQAKSVENEKTKTLNSRQSSTDSPSSPYDSKQVPGLPANKRLTMDLLYKKSSTDQTREAAETAEAKGPKPLSTSTMAAPPAPPLPISLLSATTTTAATGNEVNDKRTKIGAVHALAEKYHVDKAVDSAAAAEQQPKVTATGDSEETPPENTFAAALSKARKGMDKKIATKEPVDTRKESDIQWEKAAQSLNRPLVINDLDFTELSEGDDADPLKLSLMAQQNMSPNTVARNLSPSVANKETKTVKLFWKEAQVQPPPGLLAKEGVFWQKVKPVEIDVEKIGHLFETKTKEVVTKKKDDKKSELILLDTKRSNAINIGLTKLPPPRAIRTAIVKFDSSILNKESIEKILTTMLPTEEEKERITNAQLASPDIPLGNAEQFLMMLSEIPQLYARLRLWLFMLDYANIESEVAEPLMDLKLAMEELDNSKTFKYVMATLLAVGNYLNGAEVKGFQLDYLAKVPEVKDTLHKHSLVYHLSTIVMDKFPDSTDLYSELGAVARSAKVDFEEIQNNLEKMEKDCKASWDYLRMIAKHESHTVREKISSFLTDCAQRIMTLKVIHKRVINRFRKFLFYMGMPPKAIKDTKINSICKTISEFALEYRTSRDKIMQQNKRMQEKRERNKTRGKLITDTKQFNTIAKGPSSAGRKEENSEYELNKLLDSRMDGESWNHTFPKLQVKTSGNTTTDVADDEILDGLIKAASVKAEQPREQRRRARQFDRKSLRRTRTLKLVEDQMNGRAGGL